MTNEEFGCHLWRLIFERGWGSVKEFAKAADVHYQTMLGYVSGAHEPTRGKLCRIRDALGCTWEELLG